jgi:hypothetical protein
MALINCPECSKEVSDKAPACPNCGVVLNASSTETNVPVAQTTFPSTQNIQKTSGIAIASLVTALLCIPLVSIVLGHIARRDIKRDPNLTGAGIAKAGLILGYTPIILILLAALLLPALTKVKPRDLTSLRCYNNMKQIHLAQKMWANDNGYPLNYVTTKNDLLEYLGHGSSDVLVCPKGGTYIIEPITGENQIALPKCSFHTNIVFAPSTY